VREEVEKMAGEGTDDYSLDPKKIEEWERFSKAIKAAEQRDEKGTVELALTPALQETGIVERFDFYPKTHAIMLSLNHLYDKKCMICYINTKNWNFTCKSFENQGIHSIQIILLQGHLYRIAAAYQKNYYNKLICCQRFEINAF
jgi:hypothetical protein